jgi:hypothetical protein
MTPAPVTGVAAAADPFAAVAGPSTAALPSFGAQTITTTVVLNPGNYSGLVSVNNGGTAKLNPGNYVFRAGLRTMGTGSLVLNVPGAGVLLYNANASYPAAGGACGALTLGGTGTLTLAASNTGSYAGMLVFQDRACTNAASITVRTATSLGGTLYVPAATLTMAVANSVTIASQIVADQLTINGNNTLTMTFTPASITGTRVPALVE